MIFKQSVILMVFASLAITASGSILPEQDTNISLLSFMARSNKFMQRNPTRSVECFDYYLPLINECGINYKADYAECSVVAQGKLNEAETATSGERKDLADRALKACNVIKACSEISSVEGEFECFVNRGSENAKTMYKISDDSSQSLSNFREKSRLIDSEKYKCTNETQRTFDKKFAELSGELNKCNLGITEVPASTEAPVETEAPEITDAPAETEAPVETEAPEVTEAPVETEAPEVTEAPVETEAPEVTEAPVETEAPEVTEAPAETEAPEVTDAPENPESSESSESPESPESKLPEEDLSLLRKTIKSRRQKLRH